MKKEEVKQIVKKHYGTIAVQNGVGCGCSSGCCGDKKTTNEDIAKSIGYQDSEIRHASEANLGLGCGNPTGISSIKEGDVVLDLGSGAGFDCFLAAQKTGSAGRVIGVDLTQEMIDKADQNKTKFNHANVEFRLGDIEDLPVEDASVDVIISNCVINLAPDKLKVFQEAHRVLRRGGRMFISDIVLLRQLSDDQRGNEELIAGCVGGAMLKDEYLAIVKNAGFEVKILSEDTGIGGRQYQGLPLESLLIEATK
ncbi:arsenite S-adenosylmethyltransferase [Candidatus Wirthbacteria bacterium CG2_30_54_11]|uniref:Arsenite methyltransferase n=1 Tax=Candidatus Wirthbacteria bacterium CG2_30_54_11 TaxID=1817892 RepID=A0A1J5IYD1_9BACT|nr:MAG: arsenite S-adenosylmethyltransferase [Candidatus Wirthbacteria bacterium CG2_30_54_11]